MSRTSAYSLDIGTESKDANAIILLVDGALVAVLVELADECHGDDRGKWIIEATFGVQDGRRPENFPNREDAAAWVSSNLGSPLFLFDDDLVPLA